MWSCQVSSKNNSEVYRNILHASLQRNASNFIVRNFIMRQDDNPKHTPNTTMDFTGRRGEKKWKSRKPGQVKSGLYPIEHAIHLLKRTLKEETPKTNNK